MERRSVPKKLRGRNVAFFLNKKIRVNKLYVSRAVVSVLLVYSLTWCSQNEMFQVSNENAILVEMLVNSIGENL